MAEKKTKKKMRPALSPEMRENQLISLAMDQAERDLLNGTASSQVVTHFLKLGTVKAELEKEKLENENALLKAKTKSIENMEDIKAMYEGAINALKSYNGGDDEDEY